jgi:RNA polymerase sigma-70 factor, ECF subfamily
VALRPKTLAPMAHPVARLLKRQTATGVAVMVAVERRCPGRGRGGRAPTSPPSGTMTVRAVSDEAPNTWNCCVAAPRFAGPRRIEDNHEAMPRSPLSQTFAVTVKGTAPGYEPPDEAALQEYAAAARNRWPDFGTEDVEFIRYAAARAQDGKLQPAVHAADLMLAHACSRGMPSAIEAFHRVYGPVMDRVLSHRQASADIADDTRQIVSERLLVGDAPRGVGPKIADYRGSGPLKSWVASTAATTLMALRRASSRRREQAEESDQGASPLKVRLDPELEYLKDRYKAEVEQAIVHSLDQLSDRDRTLLRLHLGERLSIDVLGSMYSVNRATAARWLAAARRSLLEGARERLRSQLRLSNSECDSIVALVQSRLDISIVRRLSDFEGVGASADEPDR